MAYTLFAHPLSPFSYLIHAVLVYKNLDFNFEFVNLQEGEHKKNTFIEMNPFGQVPVLIRHEGLANIPFYESWAIYEYLEEVHPEKSLLPKDNPARCWARAMAHSVITEMISYARPLFLEKIGRLTNSDEHRAHLKKMEYERLNVFQKLVQQLLESSDYSFERLLVFDPLFFQAWNNLYIALPCVVEDFPLLNNYHQTLAKHPTIKTLEAEPAVIKFREFFASKK